MTLCVLFYPWACHAIRGPHLHLAETRGDAVLDQNRQRLPMPPAFPIQSAVAAPPKRGSAGALHSGAHRSRSLGVVADFAAKKRRLAPQLGR